MKQNKQISDLNKSLHDFKNDLNGILSGISCLKENFSVDSELSLKIIELLDEKRASILKHFNEINLHLKKTN